MAMIIIVGTYLYNLSSGNYTQLTVTFITIHLWVRCLLPLIKMLCAVLLALQNTDPTSTLGLVNGSSAPNMGLRSDLKRQRVSVWTNACMCV